jgi:hypothetical protein
VSPAILTVDLIGNLTSTSFVTIVTTASHDSLDPTFDILADLDALDDLEALEAQLLEVARSGSGRGW